MKGPLSSLYVSSVLSVEDVTPLALRVQEAHGAKTEEQV